MWSWSLGAPRGSWYEGQRFLVVRPTSRAKEGSTMRTATCDSLVGCSRPSEMMRCRPARPRAQLRAKRREGQWGRQLAQWWRTAGGSAKPSFGYGRAGLTSRGQPQGCMHARQDPLVAASIHVPHCRSGRPWMMRLGRRWRCALTRRCCRPTRVAGPPRFAVESDRAGDVGEVSAGYQPLKIKQACGFTEIDAAVFL